MQASLRTSLCDLLGIDVPIVQAGMGYVARGELAAAVSEAGALGVIGAASLNAEGLRAEIRKVRDLTDRPFGVDRHSGDRVIATTAEERGKELEGEVSTAETNYRSLAQKLSKNRKTAARKFAAAVTSAMSGLGMPNGKFDIAISALPLDDARPWGLDEIEFLISANPGQPPMPLSRVASGGELSRMSLSIQVIASNCSAIPTMIFDEVDSGVGGGVAEMVGRRLCELGQQRQVLCVTHLPQVASLADQHFRISKVTDGQATRTGVHALGKEERIEELARMLGGVDITEKTIAHAAEMLAGSPKKRA
jgi:DNA repair protein RecN (Recombination protein N)